jgi:predicted nucleic acid-binding protein
MARPGAVAHVSQFSRQRSPPPPEDRLEAGAEALILRGLLQHHHGDGSSAAVVRAFQARELLDAEAGSLIVSPFVLAELDYMLLSRAGVQAELTLLNDLADNAHQVVACTAHDVVSVAMLVEQYADLKLGIPEAHTMILAAPALRGS